MSDKHYKQCDCGAQVPCGTEKCEVCETITRLSSENAALRERVSVLAEMVDANSAEVRGILTVGETVKDGIVRLFKEAAALRADLARVEGERDEHRSTLLTLESDIAMLETMVYEIAPGEYSPDGWTFKQAFAAECGRRKEAEAARDAALAEVGRVRGIATRARDEVVPALRRCESAIRPVIDAIKESPNGDVLNDGSTPYADDAHVEITLTAFECRALQAALTPPAPQSTRDAVESAIDDSKKPGTWASLTKPAPQQEKNP